MAKITREQVEKINSTLSNGWQFDVKHFFMWNGEKTVEVIIPFDDDENKVIKARLYFSERYRQFKRDGLEINLNISVWHNQGTAWTSYGLGINRTIPYTGTRKKFADLAALTEIINNEYIMEIYNTGDNSKKCLDGIILDKNGWKLHTV